MGPVLTHLCWQICLVCPTALRAGRICILHHLYTTHWSARTFLLFFFPPFYKRLLASYLFIKYLARHWRKKQMWINHKSLPLSPFMISPLFISSASQHCSFSSRQAKGYSVFYIYYVLSPPGFWAVSSVSKNALPSLLPLYPPSSLYLTPTQSFWSQLRWYFLQEALLGPQSEVPFLCAPMNCSQHCTFKTES